jgi:branched-chain amino acid transport system substrate-binding protein
MTIATRLLLAAAPIAAALLAIPSAQAADTYDIPVIMSVTGSGAFLGKQEQEALMLEEKSVNAAGGIHGKPMRFIIHDDNSSPQQAVQATTEIIAQHPPVILGPALTGTCGAAMPLGKAGPVMYCFASGVHPAPGSFGFSGGVSTHDQMHVMINFFRLKGWTRVAYISSTDATGQDGDDALKEVLAEPGNKDITITELAHFNLPDVSVSAQIERIKAGAPQALIAWTTGTPAGTVFRGLIQSGADLPVATNAGNVTYAQMTQFAAFLPKQLYLTAPEWVVGEDKRIALDPHVLAKQREFYAAFAAAGIKPDEGSMLGWDPGTIIVDALKALPENATAAQLRDHLIHLKGQPGVGGMYDFEATPQRGLSINSIVVTRWDPPAGKWLAVTQPGGTPVD